MTAIVGILCQQGVVIGTDSSATFGSGRITTIEQPTEKLHIIGDKIIIAGTGQVGLGQRFQAIVHQAWDEGIFNGSAIDIAKHISKQTIEDFSQTHAPREAYGALVAFPAEDTFHLCEFAVSDLQPEFKTDALWYVSLGVTLHITDCFLALMRELFWKTGRPPLYDGIFAAIWTLDHAASVNPGGVNWPIKMSILRPTDKGEFQAEILPPERLDEYRQHIEEAKEYVREYCRNLSQSYVEQAPDIPKP